MHTNVKQPEIGSPAMTVHKQLPDFDDPRVQIVYEILCNGKEPPNRDQHWEGWVSRNIVAALYR